jgi:uncharacterized protein (DUF1330 family)
VPVVIKKSSRSSSVGTIGYGIGFVNSAVMALTRRLAVIESGPKEFLVPAYVIFDVEIRDPARYQDFIGQVFMGQVCMGQVFIGQVKPTLPTVGARYLARGGAHKVHEGDWSPRRIVKLEFPSEAVREAFDQGPVHQGLEHIRLEHIRDECSSARLVSVEGLGA